MDTLTHMWPKIIRNKHREIKVKDPTFVSSLGNVVSWTAFPFAFHHTCLGASVVSPSKHLMSHLQHLSVYCFTMFHLLLSHSIL